MGACAAPSLRSERVQGPRLRRALEPPGRSKPEPGRRQSALRWESLPDSKSRPRLAGPSQKRGHSTVAVLSTFRALESWQSPAPAPSVGSRERNGRTQPERPFVAAAIPRCRGGPAPALQAPRPRPNPRAPLTRLPCSLVDPLCRVSSRAKRMHGMIEKSVRLASRRRQKRLQRPRPFKRGHTKRSRPGGACMADTNGGSR